MAVTDKKIHPNAKIALRQISLRAASVAASQADVAQDRAVIPFDYEIVEVYAHTGAITGTSSVNAKIGGVSILAAAITPTATAGAVTEGTLSTTRSAITGSAGDVLVMHATTASSSSLTNARMDVWVRPRPLNGEA